MKVLTLGGTKFIGPHVVRQLAKRGHDITIFHRGETKVELPSSVRHVHSDFSEFTNHVDQLPTAQRFTRGRLAQTSPSKETHVDFRSR